MKAWPNPWITSLCMLVLVPVSARAAEEGPARASVRVDASKVLRTVDRRMLIGSNVAAWNQAENFTTPELRTWLEELGIGIIRMPGGSWSDIIYWNGNGVRDEEGNVDPTRMKDGYPDVDYSSYKPSFVVGNTPQVSDRGWHGHVDVKTMHDYVNSITGCRTLVCVNAGTGRASDAAEWVRWANIENGWNIRYWEVGNELEGSWEAGHILPDGTELTAEMYAQRYIEFAKAMKAVDPTIKVGGAACGASTGGFTDVLLRDAGDYVDFVSWHTYPCQAGLAEEKMFQRTNISHPMASVRQLIRQYQPAREKEIEICVTEWNLHADRTSTDLINALWSCIWVGEMVKEGMDFATQWDAFTQGHGDEGGHALVIADKPFQRKSQYWAFWLWRYYMGNEYIASKSDAPAHVYSLATRSNNAVYLMLVNTSRDKEATITVDLANFRAAAQGEAAR